MGATAVIARVFAQIQKLFDVHVPCFEVGTDGAFALAALINGHSRVINHFEERHDPLALSVGALDIGAQCPHRRPIITQSTSELGQHGVVLNRAVDAKQIIWHGRQVARAELWSQRSRIK